MKNKSKVLYLELVCNQYDGFALELLLYAFFKYVFPYMSIDSRQRIIKEEDVPVGVDGSGQTDPLLLSSWQIQPTLSNLKKTNKPISHKLFMSQNPLSAKLIINDKVHSETLPC